MHTPSSSLASPTLWPLVACLGLVLALCFGVTINAFSLYSVPLADAFGATREQANRAAGAFFLTQSLMMPVAGWLFAHVATHRLMSAGVALAGVSCLMAAQASTLNGYVLWMGVCGVGIGLSTYIPAFALVARRALPQQQSWAFSGLLAAISAGGIVFPPVLNRLLLSLGWSSTLQVCGALLLVVCAPLLWCMARAPHAPQPTDTHTQVHTPGSVRQALRSRDYWMWVLMLALMGISTIGLLMNLAPYLVSLGFSSQQAAYGHAATGVATLVGNVLFGWASTRWGARASLLAGIGLSVLGMWALMAASYAPSPLLAIAVFCLLWGVSFNAANLLSPMLLIDAMGARHFAPLLGLGNLLSGMACALGPGGFGWLVDYTGAYPMAAAWCTALLVVALLPTWLLRRAPAATPPMPQHA